MESLRAISQWLEETLLPYGGIGLMVIAICDSSFLSLPEVNDILLMTFSINQPERMVWFAGLTVLGSTIGCALLYSVGRRGGEALLKRRVSAGQLDRMRGWYGRYGILTIIVPSLLPPPTPFKIFVMSAGIFGVSWPRFLFAVSVGRSIRYFSEGVLAVLYGETAIAFVRENFGPIGIAISALILLAVLLYVWFQRRAS